jgi:hypothetical protein
MKARATPGVNTPEMLTTVSIVRGIRLTAKAYKDSEAYSAGAPQIGKEGTLNRKVKDRDIVPVTSLIFKSVTIFKVG